MNEQTRFFNICETVLINLDSITISIFIFVVKISDHELPLKTLFQRVICVSFININNESLKIVLHFLNEKKRMNFLRIFVENINN